MRRALAVLSLILWCALCAHGQGASGQMTAQGATCAVSNACVVTPTLPASSGAASFTLSGTWSATVQFEASGDNQTTWVSLNVTPTNATTAVTSATGNGTWQANIAGYTNVRLRVSAFTSGTVVGTINISYASARANGGGGGGGSGTVSGQAAGVIPLGTSATVIGNQSHCNDGNTTAATITCTEPITSTGALTAGSSGGVGGTLTLPEGTAASAASSNDICYADSTAHGIKCSYNSGSFFLLPRLLNEIGSPSGNSTFSMTGDTLNFNWGSTNTNDFIFNSTGNPTFGLVSTSTAITSSPTITIQGSYENASTPTFAADTWTIQNMIGSGLNGSSLLTFTHSGTPQNFPQASVQINGGLCVQTSGSCPANLNNGDISVNRGSGNSFIFMADTSHYVQNFNGDFTLGGATRLDVNASDTAPVYAAGYISAGTKFILSANACSATTTLGGASVGSFVSGTTGTCTVTITFGNALTAPNGWHCSFEDHTTPANFLSQTGAASTTTASMTGTTVSGDLVSFGCLAY